MKLCGVPFRSIYDTLNRKELRPKDRLNGRRESFDLLLLKMREMRFSKVMANEPSEYSMEELRIYSNYIYIL